ncbi:MAG: dTDP-4-dehydrorhamnose 3,5-epimerase [Nitrospirae bacterium]|nr:dTDP-4-dehydrorhamnose 3,5-epimerase [Nitrospirota bacterium]
MGFVETEIKGVLIRDLRVFNDHRGWLTELFREDDLPEHFNPAMSYISLTYPGIVRGPHEHRYQTDYFCFFGDFTLYLWDNRADSETYGKKATIKVDRKIAIVPPGVVHAYKNEGSENGFVINFPDRLYAGRNKSEPVDEVRYEDDPDSPFRIE